MSETFRAESPEPINAERLESIWEGAYNQDEENRKALEHVNKAEALEIVRASLGRMAEFESAADKDKADGLKISREVAERIGSIWIFSGVGTYDKPVKTERTIDGKKYRGDNDKLKDKKFLHWSNRRRISEGVLLARRIAEARSGKKIEAVSFNELPEQREEIKKLIAEYGPYIIFGGYDIENIEAQELMDRETSVIPAEKMKIAKRKDGIPMETTPDQIKYYESPEDVRDKEVAFVSDGTHLNRILHIAQKFPQNLPPGKPVNLFPARTPEYGRQEFADMEAKGLLAYIYRYQSAATEPYPYIIER